MTRDEIINGSRTEGGMFVVIPSVVQLDSELPLSAKMLYGIITWKCSSYAFTWATNRALGEALGVSAKRISSLLALLEQRGHIETEIEYRDGTREVLHRHIYPIMKSARTLARDTPPPKNEDTHPSERGYLPPGTSIPPPKNAEVICNINKQKENEKNSPYSPPEGDKPVYSSKQKKSVPKHFPKGFEIFWKAYPKKKKRLAATKAWDKLKPDVDLCRVMWVAFMRDLKSSDWHEQGGKFIPDFSSWLNGRRWEDEGIDPSLLPVSEDTSGGWADDPEVIR